MRGRGTVFFIAFTLLGAAFLVALGTWQWNRRAEKLAFISAIEAAAKAPAKPVATAQLWDRVTITGRFLPEKVVYIRTSRAAPKPGERDSRGRVPVSGFGVWVMQAFEYQHACQTPPCETQNVLVSRGFLPTPPDGRIPQFDTPTGVVAVSGFLRPAEKAGIFPPFNDPEKGNFFFRDSEQIAMALRLPHAENGEAASYLYPKFIDREALKDESTPPFGVEVKDFLKAIPNNHLEYAITWWSLAATNLAVAGFFLLSRRRRKDERASAKTP